MRLVTYFIMIFTSFIGILISAEELPPYIILDKDGNKVGMENIIDIAEDGEVIFFGEKHNSSVSHYLEMEILKSLTEKVDSLAVAMEMFEADNQTALNKYLTGKIDEQEFKNSVRLWENYDTDYRPLIEFSRENNIPVIAANIPRRLASMVSRGGIESWDTLSENEKKFIPQKYKFLEDKYKELFLATMDNNPMMKQMGKVNINNLYYAQCVKDEKMAESVAEFLSEHPKYKIICYNGSFHSDYGLGIPQKLLFRMPNLQIITISTVIVPEDLELDAKNFVQELDRADFIIFSRQ
ncbi:iron-regulated protein [bacterium]|nr:MAG: iron-regulated protein [bacterium]